MNAVINLCLRLLEKEYHYPRSNPERAHKFYPREDRRRGSAELLTSATAKQAVCVCVCQQPCEEDTFATRVCHAGSGKHRVFSTHSNSPLSVLFFFVVFSSWQPARSKLRWLTESRKLDSIGRDSQSHTHTEVHTHTHIAHIIS